MKYPKLSAASLLLGLLLLLGSNAQAQHATKAKRAVPKKQARVREGYVPPEGFVPDSATAVRLAEAFLIPIFGNRRNATSRPLHPKLTKDGVWRVSNARTDSVGYGGIYIEISKRDGRVLYFMYWK